MASQAKTPIALLAGPQLVGMFLNWALQGVLTVQVYFYHSWFPQDRASLKSLVYGILIYEWVQTGLITDVAFQNFVYGYGQREVLIEFHNTWFSVTIMSSVLSAVVQGYFAWRIWVLSRSIYLTGAVFFLSIAQMLVGVAGGIMLRVISPTAAEASHVTPVISGWLGGAAFVDIIIAVAMTFLLLRAKSGLKRSDDMVNSLVRLVIETGTLTAAVAVADLVCFTAFSNTLLHECPALVLAKLYSNTLIASLNNRALIRDNVMMSSSTNSHSLGSMRIARRSGFDDQESNRSMEFSRMHADVREETFVSRDPVDVVLTDTAGKDHDGLSRTNSGDSRRKVPVGV